MFRGISSVPTAGSQQVGPSYSLRRAATAMLIAVSTWLCMVVGNSMTVASAGTDPEIGRADSAIVTTCAGRPATIAARWYFPSTQPTAIVWLQHGFSRTASNLSGVAEAYAAKGFLVVTPQLDSVNLTGCAVAFNTADNAAFARTLARVFGGSSAADDPLSRSLGSAARRAHRTEVTMPEKMVFAGHSAGGEFVLIAANALRTADPSAYRRLAGLVLLDPVNSFFGGHFFVAARDLGEAGLPIRVIGSQPSMSNIAGLGVATLQETTEQRFLGVRLVTGVHIDAEGEATDLIGMASEMAIPRPRNARVINALATAWSADMVGGTETASYYPGGRYYDMLLATHTVTTLPVR